MWCQYVVCFKMWHSVWCVLKGGTMCDVSMWCFERWHSVWCQYGVCFETIMKGSTMCGVSM